MRTRTQEQQEETSPSYRQAIFFPVVAPKQEKKMKYEIKV
jgi:hypothetical protein